MSWIRGWCPVSGDGALWPDVVLCARQPRRLCRVESLSRARRGVGALWGTHGGWVPRAQRCPQTPPGWSGTAGVWRCRSGRGKSRSAKMSNGEGLWHHCKYLRRAQVRCLLHSLPSVLRSRGGCPDPSGRTCAPSTFFLHCLNHQKGPLVTIQVNVLSSKCFLWLLHTVWVSACNAVFLDILSSPFPSKKYLKIITMDVVLPAKRQTI